MRSNHGWPPEPVQATQTSPSSEEPCAPEASTKPGASFSAEPPTAEAKLQEAPAEQVQPSTASTAEAACGGTAKLAASETNANSGQKMQIEYAQPQPEPAQATQTSPSSEEPCAQPSAEPGAPCPAAPKAEAKPTEAPAEQDQPSTNKTVESPSVAKVSEEKIRSDHGWPPEPAQATQTSPSSEPCAPEASAKPGALCPEAPKAEAKVSEAPAEQDELGSPSAATASPQDKVSEEKMISDLGRPHEPVQATQTSPSSEEPCAPEASAKPGASFSAEPPTAEAKPQEAPAEQVQPSTASTAEAACGGTIKRAASETNANSDQKMQIEYAQPPPEPAQATQTSPSSEPCAPEASAEPGALCPEAPKAEAKPPEAPADQVQPSTDNTVESPSAATASPHDKVSEEKIRSWVATRASASQPNQPIIRAMCT